MGLFTPSPEKIFLKREKQALKWPSRYYDEVLDVYIEGSMGVENPNNGTTLHWDIVELSQYKDQKKAVEFLHEALRPDNIRKAKIRFGDEGKGPGLQYNAFLALMTDDSAQRKNYMRQIAFCQNYMLYKPICYYLFAENKFDLCCDTFEERLQVIYNIYTPLEKRSVVCWPEQYPEANYGFDAWQWRELLKFTKEEEREAAGKKEFEKLLGSEDPDVRNRTRKFLEAKSSKDAKRLKELMNSVMLVQKYEQDNLNVQFVDQHGDKVEIKDDLTVEKM